MRSGYTIISMSFIRIYYFSKYLFRFYNIINDVLLFSYFLFFIFFSFLISVKSLISHYSLFPMNRVINTKQWFLLFIL